jgi:hypothetical protein
MTYETLTIIVIVNAVATFSLWFRVAEKPPRPKRKFSKSLWQTEPIIPKHEPPKAISGSYPNLAHEEDRLFFQDFATFADVVNEWLADEHLRSRWRLQELPDTELKLRWYDRPAFGRRYALYYNQERLGSLEVAAGYPYQKQEGTVHSDIELHSLRLLHFSAVTQLLSSLALHLVSTNPATSVYGEAQRTIQAALLSVVWDTQRI